MYKAEHHKGWILEYNLLLPACQHTRNLHYNLYGDTILFFKPYTTHLHFKGIGLHYTSQ